MYKSLPESVAVTIKVAVESRHLAAAMKVAKS